MEDSKNCKNITLKDMIDAYQVSRDDLKKYCVFFDNTGGNVATFFSYKGHLVDFNKEMMKVETGNKSVADACEVLRTSVIGGMRNGTCVALNMDNYMPDFKNEYNKPDGCELWDTDVVFDFSTFRADEEIYKKIMKKEEDVDMMGNKWCFSIMKDFQMCLLYSYKNEDHAQKVMDSLPHPDKFMKYLIS